MTALDRKLWRDLKELKGQVLTIALVVASGVAVFVGMRSTYDSLLASRDAYYERYRFPDVFAHVSRAPEAFAGRVAAIPGVAAVETRIVEVVRVPKAGLRPAPGALAPAAEGRAAAGSIPELAAVGQIISLPERGEPRLFALHLVEGRLPEDGRGGAAGAREGEVVVLEHFARRHGIRPGGELDAVINGRLRRLHVVGVALSPEFVYPMAAGSAVLPDDQRFVVLWMRRSEVAASFELEGAFNDLLLRLGPGASSAGVRAELDRLLEPLGGAASVPRDKQVSNYVLESELKQLESMATSLPLVFLGVAALLLNVVMSRLVYLQRAQIAALKALGYTWLETAVHFLKLVTIMAVLGTALGGVFGQWLGRSIFDLYDEFFRFPVRFFRVRPELMGTALLISVSAAVAGAMLSVVRAARVPPAEGMRPTSPTVYRRTLLERTGLHRLLGPSAAMVARELERRPLRTALSVLGLSMAVGTVMVGRFNADAVELFMDIFFQQAAREDLSVSLLRPAPVEAAREIAALPGVMYLEAQRVVGARLVRGPRSREVPLIGYPEGPELRRLVDGEGRPVSLPPDGLVLTEKLAELLAVRPGEVVGVEVLEGERRKTELVVAGLVDELGGLQGHLPARALYRLLGEAPAMNQLHLKVDPALVRALAGDPRPGRSDRVLLTRLAELPRVADVGSRISLISRFGDQTASSVLVMTFFATLFAAIIAVGVVYNNARVALSLRERELASLRVLGFTREEISAILLGELAIQILLALPVGFWVGVKLCGVIAATVDPERFRFPVVVSLTTYAFAAAVTLAAGALSALLVRRKLDHLDLIGVLKTRE